MGGIAGKQDRRVCVLDEGELRTWRVSADPDQLQPMADIADSPVDDVDAARVDQRWQLLERGLVREHRYRMAAAPARPVLDLVALDMECRAREIGRSGEVVVMEVRDDHV